MYDDLAEEILQQTKLTLDHIFIGVETGSTITRIAKALKNKCPQIKVYGVEPTDSVFSGKDINQHHKRRVCTLVISVIWNSTTNADDNLGLEIGGLRK